MEKKSCILIGLAATLLVNLSLGTENASITEGHRPGDAAPGITSGNGQREVDFASHAGRYTLVNFWAAYDAASRIRNIRLCRRADSLDSTRIVLLSISMDENASVFAETLKTDGLKADRQWFAGPQRDLLRKKYGLKNNRFGNFLIDDRGIIVATDLTPEQLSGR
jgi:hypothetical protein